MKKRVLSVFLTIELVICAVATLSACGIKLKDREDNPDDRRDLAEPYGRSLR